MTRRQWIDMAAAQLAGSADGSTGVDAPRRSAELLLQAVLGVDRLELIMRPSLLLPEGARETLAALLARRRAGEPLAYLLGRREFYGREFEVTPATLIPRPETECLVDEALARLPEAHVRFADLGTGSGCLAVSLVAERPSWRGVALDVSAGALDVARRNASRIGVEARLSFVCGNFTQPEFHTAFPLVFTQGGLDLVVSNPPYISEAEYAELDPGVRDYEPLAALVPGPSGLEHPIAVVAAAWRLLRPGGLLLMEHGAAQGESVRALCPPARWVSATTGRDLAGLDRYLVAQKAMLE